jgi:hypothetical protein
VILDALARYTLAHPRVESALNNGVRFAIWTLPFMPAVQAASAFFYGFLVVVYALSGWWTGVGVFAGFGVLSAFLICGMGRATRSLKATHEAYQAEFGGDPR